MSKIELKHIDKFYGKNHILKDVNLTIEDGDFMTLLGPSGCGKTTTLRVVSGLEKPQNGTIHMDGKEIVSYIMTVHLQMHLFAVECDFSFFDSHSRQFLH